LSQPCRYFSSDGRLGHADIGITLRTYSHVLPQMEAQAAEIFAAAVAQQEENA
jgi:hypothetical protein